MVPMPIFLGVCLLVGQGGCLNSIVVDGTFHFVSPPRHGRLLELPDTKSKVLAGSLPRIPVDDSIRIAAGPLLITHVYKSCITPQRSCGENLGRLGRDKKNAFVDMYIHLP
jgi:hypothetical protein